MTDKSKFTSLYYESEPTQEEVSIDLDHTALLIVDMQNQFVLSDYGDALEFKEAGEWEKWEPFQKRLDEVVVPNSKKLLDKSREIDLEVTFGRIASHHKDGRDRSPVQKKSGWNQILLPIGHYGAEMVEELTPLSDEIVVNKTTDSVCTGTNYTQLLRNMGIKNVIISGIVTDQCVSSSVRSLADEGFNVIVVEDACAAATQEVHEMELKIINHIYCEIMSTDEVINVLDESKQEVQI